MISTVLWKVDNNYFYNSDPKSVWFFHGDWFMERIFLFVVTLQSTLLKWSPRENFFPWVLSDLLIGDLRSLYGTTWIRPFRGITMFWVFVLNNNFWKFGKTSIRDYTLQQQGVILWGGFTHLPSWLGLKECVDSPCRVVPGQFFFSCKHDLFYQIKIFLTNKRLVIYNSAFQPNPGQPVLYNQALTHIKHMESNFN